jgi:hypothetical protein
MGSVFPRVACWIAFALLVSSARAIAQPATSAELAKQLVTVMGSSGLEAIAAHDPQDPSRAIAALAFPGSQLLVVSAPYPDTATLDAYLANHMYKDVYTILQQPAISKGKLFFQDMGCDGLQGGGNGSVDIMYEDGGTQTIFDGNWKRLKLTESAYEQKLKNADAQYTRLLTALVAAAQKVGAHQ